MRGEDEMHRSLADERPENVLPFDRRTAASSDGPWAEASVRHKAVPSTRRTGILLFGVVACLYFASMSREIPWGDARPTYEVAESMAAGKGVSVATRWPSDAPPGRHGQYYAAQPWLTSLVHFPGAGLRQLSTRLHPPPEIAHFFAVVASHLAGIFLGGLTALLFFKLCVLHSAPLPVARNAALVVAFASMVWVYARSPFTEIVQITCFTGFFLAVTRYLKGPTLRAALFTGLAAGALLNSKYIYALSLPGVALLFAWENRKQPMVLLKHAGVVAVGLLPGIALALTYNQLRFGSPFSTGYHAVEKVMVENPFLGMWGFFFSPGKSLFLYVPPLLLAVAGLPEFYRAHRRSLAALVLTVFPVLYFYAHFPTWAGDWSWGPRYAAFAVPVLLLPMVAFFAQKSWPRRGLTVLLVGAGLWVQLLGNSFYWDHFIRIAAEVRTQWLGNPNRKGALTKDKGGFCEGCFEDTYATAWLPPLQPIIGHAWLLRHVPFQHDAKVALEDAPWRVHTRLPLDLAELYARVRVDHFAYDLAGHRKTRVLLIAFPLIGGGLLLGAMVVGQRRRKGSG